MKISIKTKPGMNPPKVSSPFLDGLSLTCHVPVPEREGLVNNLLDLQSISTFGPKTSAYHHSRRISLVPHAPAQWDKTGDNNLLVQCDPKPGYGHLRFLRCEWNPSKVVPDFVAETINGLAPNLYERLVTEGTVTRLDVAVDIEHMAIQWGLFHLPGLSISTLNMKSGKTMKFGGSLGNQQLVIYDKKAETKENNKKKPPELKRRVPRWPVTRVEFRLTPSNKRLDQMPALPNPFAALTIALFMNADTGDDLWRLFLFVAQFAGAGPALQIIKNKTTRTTLAKRLKTGAVDWWDADAIWNAMPMLVDEVLTAAPDHALP